MKKKVSILLLALCLILVTVACSSPSPSDALKADLENAKSSPEDIVGDIGDSGFSDELNTALVNKMLEFEYEIGEEKVDGDTATVELTITTYPFGDMFTTVINDLMDKATNSELSADTDTDALVSEMLNEQMDNAEKSYTKTITVELAKEDNQWVVQESVDYGDAITGGLYTFADNL